MILTLVRDLLTDQSTTGRLYLGGHFECFILEPPGDTAIPVGVYPVVMRWSPKRQITLPGVEDVPGRTDIEIHVGNGPGDTEGCLLPGQLRVTDWVASSRLAFDALMRKLQVPGPMTLVVLGLA